MSWPALPHPRSFSSREQGGLPSNTTTSARQRSTTAPQPYVQTPSPHTSRIRRSLRAPFPQCRLPLSRTLLPQPSLSLLRRRRPKPSAPSLQLPLPRPPPRTLSPFPPPMPQMTALKVLTFENCRSTPCTSLAVFPSACRCLSNPRARNIRNVNKKIVSRLITCTSTAQAPQTRSNSLNFMSEKDEIELTESSGQCRQNRPHHRSAQGQVS